MTLPQEIIRQKRDGRALSAADITSFVNGIAAGKVAEGQVAAFCMAVLLNKMTMEERVALTSAMARSGTVMDWSREGLSGPVLDKHSTGGIGDKVSLMLAPIIAACGGYVPMLSGRGLGHTGGTLDKMDSIPGYVSQPDTETFRRVVRDVGCAIIGATPDLAPADRIVYSIRDVTATVESLDLITASILSKKLAAGLDALVMDVKFGSGAFMQKYEDARALAQSIATVATGAGLPTVALLTDMNEVLGRTAGNALEVAEAVAYLRGDGARDPRLHAVTVELCAEMLCLGKLAPDLDTARRGVENALHSGKAADIFGRMVAALGGPADFIERPAHYLKPAAVIRPLYAEGAGTLVAIDTRAIGMAIVEMGGGRIKPSDTIDHAVGITDVAAIGAKVDAGTPLLLLHAATEDAWQNAAAALRRAMTIDATGGAAIGAVITERITA